MASPSNLGCELNCSLRQKKYRFRIMENGKDDVSIGHRVTKGNTKAVDKDD